MTQAELIGAVAEEAGIKKAAAGRIVDFIARSIIADLVLDGKSRFPGLGIFTKVTRAPRTFRNTFTGGKPIKKPARKAVKFKLLAHVKKQVEAY
jgi:DNA-binding protein HU-beta